MRTKVEMVLKDGTNRVYQDDQVVSATIIEANDPLNRELQIGTLELVLHTTDDDFDFFNPLGIASYIYTNQKLQISEILSNNTTEILGIYYVSTWTFEQNNQIRIYCVDAIGMLDLHICREDFIQQDDHITKPIGQLFTFANISNDINVVYDNAGDDRSKQIESGNNITTLYPPIISCRELLSSILAQTDSNLIIKPNGIPYLFTDLFSNLFYNINPAFSTLPSRPIATNYITKSMILLASNNNNKNTKIKSIEKEVCVQYNKKEQTKLFDEIVQNNQNISLYFDTNYTDFVFENITSTEMIILEQTRSSIIFRTNYSNVSSKRIKIYAKEIENQLSNDKKLFLEETENGEDIKYINPIYNYGIHNSNVWFQAYNDGFTANIEFLCGENFNQFRAGSIVNIEFRENILYTGVIIELTLDVSNGMIATAKVLCTGNYIEKSEYIITEDANYITTENGDRLRTEGY